MKICFICTEIFAWGKYGGFGRVTRTIGSELVRHGFEVFAVVPRRQNQNEIEILDGIKVLSFPAHNPFFAKRLFKSCDADIYHSEEPSFLTYLAANAMPEKIHLVTSRDPRTFKDWLKELMYPSKNIFQVLANYFFENNLLVTKSVRRADKVFCTAKYLEEKVKAKYKLKNKIEFLPTPIVVPTRRLIKSNTPLVCFVSRLDRRKRPEIFFQLAESFPNVRFIITGESRDKSFQEYLFNKYSHLKNLEIRGFIDQFSNSELKTIFERSWILINTSVREGLPNSVLEAMAHKCAILSSVNSENVASRFGVYVKNDDFKTGLQMLFENNKWKPLGELGQQYVIENYEFTKAINMHINVYETLIKTFYHRTIVTESL